MKVSLGLIVLLALLDPGTCLQCEVCHGIGKSCSGPMKTCTGGEDTCGIFLHEVLVGGMTIHSSIKSCLSSNMCHSSPVTMNYGKVKAKSGMACCTGDDCRTVSVSLLPDNNVPNGYQCPACYTLDSFQCTTEIINCTGSETQCVDLAGSMNSGGLSMKGAMKGCTTVSECRIAGDGKSTLGSLDMRLNWFNCAPAFRQPLDNKLIFAFAPQHTVFFPLLLGFVLEKLLF